MKTYKGKRKPPTRRMESSVASRLEQRALDEALCETFPASDPVAIMLLATKPTLGR